MHTQGNEEHAAGSHPLREFRAFSGGCACGGIRYECSSEPVLSFNCHCLDCQRAGGSAFASALIVPAAGFEIMEGKPKYHAVKAASGYFIQRGFCPECGSQVLAKLDHRPLIVIIQAGSLDAPGWHRPEVDIFASRPTLGSHGLRASQVRRGASSTGVAVVRDTANVVRRNPAMAEIGTRRKRTVQEPLVEPRREPAPVSVPAPRKQPKRKEKVAP